MSKKKRYKAHKVNLDNKTMLKLEITTGIVLFVYLAGSLFFGNHFYIGSSVNGVGTSFLTAEGAYEKILSNADHYNITFVDGDGKELTEVSAKDLGVAVNYDVDQVQHLLDEQTGFNWVLRMLFHSDNYTKTGNSFDADKVKQIASTLDFGKQTSTKDSEDAYIDFDGEKFVIVDEVYGDKIDANGIEEAIIYAVENLEKEINITDGSCYNKPKVKHDDKNINSAVDELNKLMDINIHYDLGEGYKEEIPTKTKATFFKVDDKFKVDYDRDAIGEFVNTMGDKYNTFGKKKEFTTTSGNEITVPAGSFGWRIAYEGEIDQIIADFNGGKDVTRDFTYLYYGTSHGEHDYGNSYVEVNLTEQHVYVYKDGVMVVDSSCVSGNISKNHGTHTGAYPIAYKQKDATLKGANYESHVKFWMPFNLGEGLHDATWRSKFGGSIYKTSGSHGCINLPVAKAEEIYGVVEAGWPVLVFYTGDEEEEIFKLQNPQIDVMNFIADIETVTLESEPKIVAARQAYDALSDEQKALVENYQDLVNAELVLQTLKIQAAEAAAAQGIQPDQQVQPAPIPDQPAPAVTP